MYRIVLLLCLLYAFRTMGSQRFYISNSGSSVASCTSPDDPCGSLGDIIPLIGSEEVEINVFPGSYDENESSYIFPPLNLLVIQKYTTDSDLSAIFRGFNSNITISSSITIKDLHFEEYNNFLTIMESSKEIVVELNRTKFANVTVLLTNISNATVYLIDTYISAENAWYTRPCGFIALAEKPAKFVISGGSFYALNFGLEFLYLDSTDIEISGATFDHSGRMKLTAEYGSISNCQFNAPEGYRNIAGSAGAKKALDLDGTWMLEDLVMNGPTEFPTFVNIGEHTDLTIINSSPGSYDFTSEQYGFGDDDFPRFTAENCNFSGDIYLHTPITYFRNISFAYSSNTIITSSFGYILDSTTSGTFSLKGDHWLLDDVSCSQCAITFPNSCDIVRAYVNITNCNFDNLSRNIDVECTDINVQESTFDNCHSTESGGALLLSDAYSVNISNTVFTSNSAEDDGGAIYVASSGKICNVNLSDVQFIDNTASSGGAVACSIDAVHLTLDDSVIFSGNSAANTDTSNIDCFLVDPSTNESSNSEEENNPNTIMLWVFGITSAVVICFVVFILLVIVISLAKKHFIKRDEFTIDLEPNEPY